MESRRAAHITTFCGAAPSAQRPGRWPGPPDCRCISSAAPAPLESADSPGPVHGGSVPTGCWSPPPSSSPAPRARPPHTPSSAHSAARDRGPSAAVQRDKAEAGALVVPGFDPHPAAVQLLLGSPLRSRVPRTWPQRASTAPAVQLNPIMASPPLSVSGPAPGRSGRFRSSACGCWRPGCPRSGLPPAPPPAGRRWRKAAGPRGPE